MSRGIAERLIQMRTNRRISQTEMARMAGLGLRGWQKIESGNNLPSSQTLMKLAENGFNPAWILTGIGQMQLDGIGAPSGPENPQASSILQTADDDLHGRTLEAVSTAYKEAGVRISLRNLGSIASAKAREIAASSNDPAEWPVMIKYMATQLKNELQKPVSDLDNNKATA